ncbi:phosphoribosyltransferase family protein [Polycladomyces zharkentensis]|uniref:phosphoribosyltransferase family protein n=1 Tax=Polycladomyces zharkentensis TaxID=2807616 RepID=UPI00265F5214|nr:phosphoribosyltransferase family protein [Polycladomyces sp. WAk]
MAEKPATYPDAPFAMMMKSDQLYHTTAITHIIGEVEGRTLIIIEDRIDTGGTIVSVVEGLLAKDAREHK